MTLRPKGQSGGRGSTYPDVVLLKGNGHGSADDLFARLGGNALLAEVVENHGSRGLALPEAGNHRLSERFGRGRWESEQEEKSKKQPQVYGLALPSAMRGLELRPPRWARVADI